MKKILQLIFMLMITSICTFSVFSAENDFSDFRLSLVNQNPDEVIAGNIVELKVGLSNLGYTIANDVVVEFVEEYPFTLTSENKLTVGVLQATSDDNSNQQILDFRLKVDSDISAGNYDARFIVYEKSKPHITKEFILSVDVKTKESAQVILIDKSVLIPGKIEEVNFVISNLGSSVLRDLTFSWENENGVILPVGSDNSRYIKEIAVGKQVELKYNVIASSSAVSDLYKLDLNLEYEDKLLGSTNSIDTVAGIYVGGGTDFDVVFTDFANSEMSFTISNIGANNAESVTVKLDDSVKISGAKSQIIGNLNKGDYTTVSYKSSTLTSGTIPVIVEYTNTLGAREITNIEVTTGGINLNNSGETVYDKPFVPGDGSRRGLGGMVGGVSTIGTYLKYFGYFLVLVIVGLVGRKLLRKRKK